MEDSNLPTKQSNSPASIKRYQWDIDWADKIAHDVPITKVAEELSQIEEVYGEVTPEILVESSKNKSSVFHKYFEWNDQKAANLFRLKRASQILNHIHVRVIKNGEVVYIKPIEVRIVPQDYGDQKRPYRKLKDKVSDESYIPFLKRIVANDLKLIIRRLEKAKVPDDVIIKLVSVIEYLHGTTETSKSINSDG